MKTALHDKLKEKLMEAGISVHALEKQAGLKRSAVQNILHGKSKKPSAEILYAITKVLGCSIQDLIGHKDTSNHSAFSQPNYLSTEDTTENNIPLNTDLYINAGKTAAKIFKSQNFNPNQTLALKYIQEIYQYSLNSKQEDIDQRFALWLFEKLFSHQK